MSKTLEEIDAERAELRAKAQAIRTARDGLDASIQQDVRNAAAANPIPFERYPGANDV